MNINRISRNGAVVNWRKWIKIGLSLPYGLYSRALPWFLCVFFCFICKIMRGDSPNWTWYFKGIQWFIIHGRLVTFRLVPVSENLSPSVKALNVCFVSGLVFVFCSCSYVTKPTRDLTLLSGLLGLMTNTLEVRKSSIEYTFWWGYVCQREDCYYLTLRFINFLWFVRKARHSSYLVWTATNLL